MSTPDDSPVEAYLDELLTRHSRRDPRALRHLLAEVEAHLRADADAEVAAGKDRHSAEVLAVERFGSAEEIVEADERAVPLSMRAIVSQIVGSGLLLGGIGAIAVGLSGLLAWLVAVIGGAAAVVDVAPGQTLSATDCSRWLALTPSAVTCQDAAVADWIGEVIGSRLVVGVLGLLSLALYAVLRRTRGSHGPGILLPPVVNHTIAVAAFGAAGAATLVLSVDYAVLTPGHGWGQWASAVPVALGAAVYFGLRLVGDLRRGVRPLSS